VAVEVFMPKMTDFMEAGEVIRWLAQEGDQVEEGQPIMELLTDKVVAELPAPASGVLAGIRPGAGPGAMVPVGETMAFIVQPDETLPTVSSSAGTGGLQAEPEAEAQPAQRVTPSPSSEPGTGPTTGDGGRVRATPVARRVARELGVDLASVKGTGPGGSIREKDVRAFVEAGITVPAPQPEEPEVEWRGVTPAQRPAGRPAIGSVEQVPQFTLSMSADVANVLRLRESLSECVVAETGEHLPITAILVKVVAAALRQYPRANASWQQGRIEVQPQINIGVAVGTGEGPAVPVIKDADRKTLVEIARVLQDFRERAQQTRFSPQELAGGTFTISDLGMYGIDHFSAVINPPRSAALAVGRISKTPVGMPDDSIALRSVMHLTLTADHRVMDSLQAAEFLSEVKSRLEEPYLLL
jgi:pyruvate dehydrogenase E2 component (dihydrolipoamide acetyltransferase)